jgi:nucleolar protein 56
MIKIVTNVLGVFALRDGRIIKSIAFPREPKEVADRLFLSEESACDEELKLVKELISTGVDDIAVTNPSRFYGKKLEIDLEEDKVFTDVYKIASEIGIDRKEVLELITKSNIELTKKKLRVLERDQILIQAVNSLDDIDEVTNRLMERLREWYSLHFPELNGLISNPSLYASYVVKGQEAVSGNTAEEIAATKVSSMGMEFSDSDKAEIGKLAESIVKLDSFRADTEVYIGELMNDIAPNTAELAGPLLGARLIAVAGGLERLSKMPASTIQILGAEESFYRFKKTGKNPPKHGVIFQLPEIRGAARHLRGKFSRTFAAKLAITVKTDFFKGEFIGKKLRADFLTAIERMKKQPAKKTYVDEQNKDRRLYDRRPQGNRYGGQKHGKGNRGGGKRRD